LKTISAPKKRSYKYCLQQFTLNFLEGISRKKPYIFARFFAQNALFSPKIITFWHFFAGLIHPQPNAPHERMNFNEGPSMKRNLAASKLRAAARQHLLPLCILFFAGSVLAQGIHPSPQPAKATVDALLVSDIHFDPFFDPAKVPQLAAAPSTKWKAIFAAPASPDRQQRFQALRQSCHVRSEDTSFPLFDSSLKAMRIHASAAKFVTVSGDLLAHGFDCKYNALFPKSTPDDFRSFVRKTLAYVMDELYGAFPGVPVYIALGNNDSDCGDYRLDAHSDFLRVTGNEVTKNFSALDRKAAEESFAAGGYYSVSLPAPIQNARLLVLDDLFMSKSYATCAGKADPAGANAQIAWLQHQLIEARASKQKIWVMGHIPPGVDLYSTMKKMGDLCGDQKPGMFLSSEGIADVLVEFSDVVQLAIFAHTHMDEMRLLKDDNLSAASSKPVAVKMVSSISPNHDNNPSFTIAQIDPATAALVDYRVFAASNRTGVDAKWTEEYDFARSYHEKEFSSSSVSELIAGFTADPSVKTKTSQSYVGDFSAGSSSLVLQMFWPQYVCTLSNHTAQSFKACVCPAAHY
jgi:sphingomyelin phosphodiesterase acid-like 3